MNTAGAILTIDLDVIKQNYKRLCAELNGKPCAAVVKANGYGLGVGPVTKALFQAGARSFFVAQIDEGITLRELFPDIEIHILVGPHPGSEEIFIKHNLIPVLNSLDQVKRWKNRAKADLHVETGMTRLGIALNEMDQIAADLNIDVLMTHFACADDKNHPLNALQIADFNKAVEKLPHRRASMANSSGMFLGSQTHFDLGRPGCALYGINPTPHETSPVINPVRLQAKIVQVHKIDTPISVGYGATHQLKSGQKIATLALGYADGYLRSLSSKGMAHIGDRETPILGRVSMDLISIDVSNIPDEECQAGQLVDMIGPHNTPDQLAKTAGTIGYEILTNLGLRYHRVYKGQGL